VETTKDEGRPGRPFSVRNEGLIAKVRKRIQEERCVTARMMADEFGVFPSILIIFITQHQ